MNNTATEGRRPIAWDWERLARLRTAIHDAEAANQRKFLFMGDEYYVPYARYFASYLGARLRGRQ